MLQQTHDNPFNRVIVQNGEIKYSATFENTPVRNVFQNYLHSWETGVIKVGKDTIVTSKPINDQKVISIF